MKEHEIHQELARFLKKGYTPIRTTGDPGLSGYFRIYEPVPGNPGALNSVGDNFHVDSEGQFHPGEMPRKAELKRPKPRGNRTHA